MAKDAPFPFSFLCFLIDAVFVFPTFFFLLLNLEKSSIVYIVECCYHLTTVFGSELHQTLLYRNVD